MVRDTPTEGTRVPGRCECALGTPHERSCSASPTSHSISVVFTDIQCPWITSQAIASKVQFCFSFEHCRFVLLFPALLLEQNGFYLLKEKPTDLCRVFDFPCPSPSHLCWCLLSISRIKGLKKIILLYNQASWGFLQDFRCVVTTPELIFSKSLCFH